MKKRIRSILISSIRIILGLIITFGVFFMSSHLQIKQNPKPTLVANPSLILSPTIEPTGIIQTNPYGGLKPKITFNSPDLPWTDIEKNEIESFLTNMYPKIVSLYGLPAKDSPVNFVKSTNSTPPCSRVPCYLSDKHEIYFGASAAEKPENVVRVVGKGVILHEFIHSFHDGFLMPIALEEGLTEAARETILPSDQYEFIWSNFQNYEYLVENQPVSSGHIEMGDVYSTLPQYEFLKMHYVQSDIFFKINTDYYQNSEQDIIQLFLKYLPDKIEGKSKSNWIKDSFLYKAISPPFRSDLYLFLNPNSNFLTVYVLDNESGSNDKKYQITAEFFDYQGKFLAKKTKVTNEQGEFYNSVNFYFNQLFSGYKGKVKLVIKVMDPTNASKTKIEEREYYLTNRGGLSGIIRGTNEGELSIEAGQFKKTLKIIKGYFEVPDLREFKGNVILNFVTSDGKIVKKEILKLVPDYMTIINTN